MGCRGEGSSWSQNGSTDHMRNTEQAMVMTGRFTFDKVVSSGELSGPLGYHVIHHIHTK